MVSLESHLADPAGALEGDGSSSELHELLVDELALRQ